MCVCGGGYVLETQKLKQLENGLGNKHITSIYQGLDSKYNKHKLRLGLIYPMLIKKRCSLF